MSLRALGAAVAVCLTLAACSSGTTAAAPSTTGSSTAFDDSTAVPSTTTTSSSSSPTTAPAKTPPLTPTPTTVEATATPSPSESVPAQASTPGGSNKPVVHGYSFPDGLLATDPNGVRMFTRVNGTLTVPSTPGKHPLVVLVHGSYPGCIWKGHDQMITPTVNTVRFALGCGTRGVANEFGVSTGPDYVRYVASFGYLSQELARRGMAVLAMDVGAKEQPWTGEPNHFDMQTQLLKLHLKIVNDLNNGIGHGLRWASSVRGRIDTSRIGLVGHSSGGGFVLQREAAGWPGLKAVVALEAALQDHLTVQATPVPTLLLAGQCDEQIPVGEHRNGLAELAAKSNDTPLLYGQLANATHIRALTGGGSYRVGMVTPVTTPACQASRLAGAAELEGQIAQTIGDFFGPVFAGASTFTFGTTTQHPVAVQRVSGVATVRTTKVAQLPGIVAPQSITFDASTNRLLDPLPAGQKLILDSGL